MEGVWRHRGDLWRLTDGDYVCVTDREGLMTWHVFYNGKIIHHGEDPDLGSAQMKCESVMYTHMAMMGVKSNVGDEFIPSYTNRLKSII